MDYILCKKGLVSQEDCTKLIDFFEYRPQMHEVVNTTYPNLSDGTNTDAPQKINTEIGLHISDETTEIIADYLKDVVQEYKKQYPFVDKIKPWTLCEDYKIQKYNPGEGYCVLHCENDGPASKYPAQYKRVLVWMIYLNDVTDGGYTNFPEQKKKFQPRRGDVLMWPAYFTHPHEGIVSPTQTKYIITGWFDFCG